MSCRKREIYHRPRAGCVHLIISYYGRVAILGHIEIQLFYVCSYQSRKQTNKNKTARERKERKKKETETGRAKRDIQKIWRSEVRPEQSCGYRCGRFTFTRSLLHKRGRGGGGVFISGVARKV